MQLDPITVTRTRLAALVEERRAEHGSRVVPTRTVAISQKDAEALARLKAGSLRGYSLGEIVSAALHDLVAAEAAVATIT